MELLRFELYDARANHTATNVARQQRFLEELNARLAATPAEVVREVEEFRAFITQPHRMRLHVACDVSRVPRPARVWIEQFAEAFVAATDAPFAVTPVTHAQALIKPGATIRRVRGASVAESSCGRFAVVHSSESSYLIQTTSCISSFTHKDYPAMMVAIEYLTALEGDFWKRIRGLGLAYSYKIRCSPESGLLRFSLGQATDVVAALLVARNIVNAYVEGKRQLSDVTLESIKSSVVFSLVSREANVEQSLFQSFKNALRGVVPGHNQRLVHQVTNVTKADVLRMLKVYFRQLFDPSSSTIAVTTAVSKRDGVLNGLEAAGYKLVNVGKLEDWFCVDMARRGAGRNRSIGGAASPDFEPEISPGNSVPGQPPPPRLPPLDSAQPVDSSLPSVDSSGGACSNGSGDKNPQAVPSPPSAQPGAPDADVLVREAVVNDNTNNNDDDDGDDNGDDNEGGWWGGVMRRLSGFALSPYGVALACGLAAAVTLSIVWARRRPGSGTSSSHSTGRGSKTSATRTNAGSQLDGSGGHGDGLPRSSSPVEAPSPTFASAGGPPVHYSTLHTSPSPPRLSLSATRVAPPHVSCFVSGCVVRPSFRGAVFAPPRPLFV